jgi:rubrerythrin
MKFTIPCTSINPINRLGEMINAPDGRMAKITRHLTGPNQFEAVTLDELEGEEVVSHGEEEAPKEVEGPKEATILEEQTEENEDEVEGGGEDDDVEELVLQPLHDKGKPTGEYLCASCDHTWTPKNPPKQCPQCKAKNG